MCTGSRLENMLLMWTLLLFLLMDQSGFSEAQDFLHHHVNVIKVFGKHKHSCDKMMRLRGLATEKSCQKTKTFVYNVFPNKGGLCEGPPVRCVKSPDFYTCHRISFKTIQCNLYPGASPPNCFYKSHTSQRRGRVVCVGKHAIRWEE